MSNEIDEVENAGFADYAVEYEYKGDTYQVSVCAESLEDAKARVRAIGQGRVIGTVELELPFFVGWLGLATAWSAVVDFFKRK